MSGKVEETRGSPVRKLKLIGDGTSIGTQLIDVATGENLLQRYAIAAIRVETNGGTHAGPKVTLELHPALTQVEIVSRSNEAVLDILYPGLTEAFHPHHSGVEEPPAREQGVQS